MCDRLDSLTEPPTNGNRPRILVIDTDPGIRRLLHSALSNSKYKAVVAPNCEESRELLDELRADLVLIGTESPDELESIAFIKKASRAPVIVLSSLKNHMVPALDAGADDYIEKPFHVPELLAKVRVALRHAAQVAPGQTTLQLGNVTVDLERRLVTRENVPVRMARREYEVLSYMARRVGQILTCQQILHDVWGAKAESVHILREYISVLRHKLEADPSHPQFILTEPTGGYRLWSSG